MSDVANETLLQPMDPNVSIDQIGEFEVYASSLQPLNPRLRGERLLGYRVKFPATAINEEETVQVLKYDAEMRIKGELKPYNVVYLDGVEMGQTMWEKESEFDGATVVHTPAVQPEVRGHDLKDYMLSFPRCVGRGEAGSPQKTEIVTAHIERYSAERDEYHVRYLDGRHRNDREWVASGELITKNTATVDKPARASAASKLGESGTLLATALPAATPATDSSAATLARASQSSSSSRSGRPAAAAVANQRSSSSSSSSSAAALCATDATRVSEATTEGAELVGCTLRLPSSDETVRVKAFDAFPNHPSKLPFTVIHLDGDVKDEVMQYAWADVEGGTVVSKPVLLSADDISSDLLGN